MRIPGFAKFVKTQLTTDVLQNTTVVIDGQNYFYNLYQESHLAYEFGCESDKYAEYLRGHLKMYQQSNVKCYIFFKGGHQNFNSAVEKKKKDKLETKNYINSDIILPIFMKDVYKQVLSEMNIDYVVCEYEAKEQCIAFAQKYKRPIVSNDVEFCFSGVKYIPFQTIKFNTEKKCLECQSFSLNKFVNKFKLDKDKLAIFIVLKNEHIYENDHFKQFLSAAKITSHKFNLIAFQQLFKYLADNDFSRICENICRHTRDLNQERFMENLQEAKNFIEATCSARIPMQYLESGKKLQVTTNDPEWFEKGVAGRYIAIDYINLYRHKTIFSSWAIQDGNCDDGLLLSTKIIAYVYDLLTNFNYTSFMMLKDSEELKLETGSVTKPRYGTVTSSVFENGWDGIRDLKLFEHFVTNIFLGFDPNSLNQIPEEAVLIVLALAYFSQTKTADTSVEVCSVLLSYVLMGDLNHECAEKVTAKEREAAKKAMIIYFTTSKQEIAEILDNQLIHPLVEFQHCLQHLNNLNNLCGSPYKPTVYRRAYNGTFVYKFLYKTKKNHNGDVLKFLNTNLNKVAPNVVNLVNSMFDFCNSIVI